MIKVHLHVKKAIKGKEEEENVGRAVYHRQKVNISFVRNEGNGVDSPLS